MSHSYRRNFPATYTQKGANELSIGTDNGFPIYVTEEGKVRAKGFIDANDNLEFKVNENDLVSSFDTNDYTKVEINLSNSKNKRFFSKVPISFVFRNVFKKISGVIGKVLYAGFPMVKFLPKSLRKKIERAPSSYPFVLEKKINNKLYTRPMIGGSWHKAYNVPVRLSVPGGINQIYDILVVKTGCFNYVNLSGTGTPIVRSGIKEEKIVFVSQHAESLFSGYISGTGAFTRLDNRGSGVHYSGASGVEYKLNLTGLNLISSLAYVIPSGSFLSGSLKYLKITPESGLAQDATGYSNLTGSLLYQLHSGYRSYFNTGSNWNGVIPSGVPFKIETWSFNGVLAGYIGDICVMPVDQTGTQINLKTTKIGEGISYVSAAEAGNEAIQSAIWQAQNSLEAELIDKKIMPKNSKYIKYTDFIQKAGGGNINENINFIQT
jgi:hypothetical protein